MPARDPPRPGARAGRGGRPGALLRAMARGAQPRPRPDRERRRLRLAGAVDRRRPRRRRRARRRHVRLAVGCLARPGRRLPRRRADRGGLDGDAPRPPSADRTAVRSGARGRNGRRDPGRRRRRGAPLTRRRGRGARRTRARRGPLRRRTRNLRPRPRLPAHAGRGGSPRRDRAPLGSGPAQRRHARRLAQRPRRPALPHRRRRVHRAPPRGALRAPREAGPTRAPPSARPSRRPPRRHRRGRRHPPRRRDRRRRLTGPRYAPRRRVAPTRARMPHNAAVSIGTSSAGRALARGRAAYATHAWRDAYESFAQADDTQRLDPDDLLLLATSAYMLGREDEYVRALERAHYGYLDSGDVPRAARCTWWIGLSFLLRGEEAPATGWFARGERLLAGEGGDCAERGYLLLASMLESFAAGDFEAARAQASEAVAIGERFGDRDLVALGVMDLGHALLELGRAREGLRLLDESMVAVTSGELSPIVAGILYCSTITVCQSVHDLRRAREWTEALTLW